MIAETLLGIAIVASILLLILLLHIRKNKKNLAEDKKNQFEPYTPKTTNHIVTADESNKSYNEIPTKFSDFTIVFFIMIVIALLVGLFFAWLPFELVVLFALAKMFILFFIFVKVSDKFNSLGTKSRLFIGIISGLIVFMMPLFYDFYIRLPDLGINVNNIFDFFNYDSQIYQYGTHYSYTETTNIGDVIGYYIDLILNFVFLLIILPAMTTSTLTVFKTGEQKTKMENINDENKTSKKWKLILSILIVIACISIALMIGALLGILKI